MFWRHSVNKQSRKSSEFAIKQTGFVVNFLTKEVGVQFVNLALISLLLFRLQRRP